MGLGLCVGEGEPGWSWGVGSSSARSMLLIFPGKIQTKVLHLEGHRPDGRAEEATRRKWQSLGQLWAVKRQL